MKWKTSQKNSKLSTEIGDRKDRTMTYMVKALNMEDADNSISLELNIRRNAYCETVVRRVIEEVASRMRTLGYAHGGIKWRMSRPNIYYNPWYEVTLYGENDTPFALVITSDKGVLAQ